MVGETTGGFGGFWPTGCLADILGKLLPQRLNFFARVVGQQEVLEVEGGDALLVKFEKNPPFVPWQSPEMFSLPRTFLIYQRLEIGPSNRLKTNESRCC